MSNSLTQTSASRVTPTRYRLWFGWSNICQLVVRVFLLFVIERLVVPSCEATHHVLFAIRLRNSTLDVFPSLMFCEDSWPEETGVIRVCVWPFRLVHFCPESAFQTTIATSDTGSLLFVLHANSARLSTDPKKTHKMRPQTIPYHTKRSWI